MDMTFQGKGVVLMKTDAGWIVAALVILPLFNQLIFRSAVLHLFELGKSRTFLKKEKTLIPLKQKILLVGYAQRCKHYISTARRLLYLYWFGNGLYLLCVLCWTASWFIREASFVLPWFLLAKLVLFDTPSVFFFLAMTKHGKRGGVDWRWEV